MKKLLFLLAISLLFACKNKPSSRVIEPKATDSTVLYIDLFHDTHTDFGFTDHPIIAEYVQKRFFDIAVDMALETSNSQHPFCWTAEAMEIVVQWWNEASPERRNQLKKLIKNKQISINALPLHFAPLADDEQMKTLTSWVDDELWSTFQPTVAMQNDVNGFPRSAAIKLLDKGIKFFWTGINDLNNGAPFKQPFPFWWKMPDGRRMLVMSGLPYWEGYSFFAEKEWRSAQREASNLQFWSPREGDMLQSDEASVRKAYEICLKKIKKIKKEGYKYDFIITSITNQWRIDNDGPFSGLSAFVAKWNELGLQPRLNLVTIGEAMQKVESRVGKILPKYEGEWTDWWAFGAMANPPELSAAKQSANYLDAALSPVWGQPTEGELAKANEINHLLGRYYEHTWANNESHDNPYGAFNVGHLAEKAKFAYYPYVVIGAARS